MKKSSQVNDPHLSQSPLLESGASSLSAFTARLNQFGIGCCCIEPGNLVILESNSVFGDFVGLDGKDLIGRSLSVFLPEMEKAGIVQSLESLRDNDQSSVSQTLHVQGDGDHQRWIKATFVYWDQGDEREGTVVATAVDITESVKADEERKQAIQRLELAQKHSKVGCWELPKGSEVVWWSKEMYESFRWDPSGLAPTFDQFMQFVHIDDREAVLKAHQTEPELHRTIEVEFRAEVSKGQMRWFHATITSVQRGRNAIRFGTTQDVTERHQMESAIVASERLYREIVEQSAEGITIVDVTGHVVKVNDIAAQMFGYEPEDLVGKNIFSLIGDASKDDLQTNYENRAVGSSEAVEYRVKHRDGHDVWVLVSTRPYFDDGGKFCGTRNVVVNISHRKLAEELARKAEIANARLDMLSSRERNVFSRVVEGDMNKVIAKRLDISEKTVERHRSNVMKKLGVKSITELVRIALDAESVEH
ncbi:PAS domain S-box-containing protein [Neorhodopirellula lusitana]|uniref:histidine kinase n=1 Tax=Neorhodopirellula lusitana TaxID=445327 RepID=A0ABY1PTK3_9BACT|nr:PAS domain S-box protein [Neorhodopirellula lusitana]SMP46903.1 PAS domain S-box-containing protein [Neorhodopirellula lusitana]